MDERYWRDNPHLSESEKAELDRLYNLWLANGRKPVLIEDLTPPEPFKELYLDIDTSQSPYRWTMKKGDEQA